MSEVNPGYKAPKKTGITMDLNQAFLPESDESSALFHVIVAYCHMLQWRIPHDSGSTWMVDLAKMAQATGATYVLPGDHVS